MSGLQLILFISVGIAVWLSIKTFRRYRQKDLFKKPLPSSWITILKKRVALYSILPESLCNELHGHIQIFLDEKEFIGQGIQITDEIKLTIAGNACILLLQGLNNIENERSFADFTTIIVYPDTYVARQNIQEGLAEHQEFSTRAGESWVRGPIVLSWKDAAKGSRHPRDGHNVVLHEFAHKLDEKNNIMDGLPVLKDKSQYKEWAKTFREEYEALKQRAKNGDNKVLDEYGTTSPPEFFAVATESFFEKPKRMKKQLPNLYQQLETYFGVDPANWNR